MNSNVWLQRLVACLATLALLGTACSEGDDASTGNQAVEDNGDNGDNGDNDRENGDPTPHPDLVEFSSEDLAFIIGPQVKMGASLWPFFDENMAAKAEEHRNTAVAAMEGNDGDTALNANYYDLGLALYTLYARTEDPLYLQYARDVTSAWWETMPARVAWDPGEAFSVTPRNSSTASLVIYALEGGGAEPLAFDTWQDTTVDYDLWGWLTDYARHHYFIWLERSLDNDTLWFGVRDGAYTLLLMAHLAKVHPDEQVREEMLENSLRAARDYYARLQHDDGGWYWDIDDGRGHVTAQPFMIGMLMEAMIAVHQLTDDESVAHSILRAADWLWEKGYERTEPTNLEGVQWRAMRYFVFSDDRESNRESAAEYGMEDGAIRDARQLNATAVHTFGYAFLLTGDEKYRQWGDDVFSATYGKGEGPGADAYWGLADFRAREYNQSYRTGGRYLAWRLSH